VGATHPHIAPQHRSLTWEQASVVQPRGEVGIHKMLCLKNTYADLNRYLQHDGDDNTNRSSRCSTTSDYLSNIASYLPSHNLRRNSIYYKGEPPCPLQ